jgi:hypothetical protein
VGTQPAVTFIGTGLPPGATLYLERGSAAGTGWRDVARSAAPSGTSKIPAAPAGRYEYRMVAIDRGKVIAASPDAALTVTGKRGACTGLCAVGHAVLPWLKPFEQPVADAIAGAVVTWLIGLLFF